jgi:hypothetical protein
MTFSNLRHRFRPDRHLADTPKSVSPELEVVVPTARLAPCAGLFLQLLGPSLVAFLGSARLFVYVMSGISRGSAAKQ